MKLDFWNNPIVVSAFRVKYRRSAPTLTATLYFLTLASLGGILHHYFGDIGIKGKEWHHVYFVAVMAIQAFVSGLVALTSTSASLTAEVANKTLDFQRIAALSPAQILVGKLFGEPAVAYMLMLASVPIAVGCSLLGGTPPLVVVLLYFNLFTTTLFFGSLGLMHPLEQSPNKAAGGSGNPALGWIIGLFSALPAFLGSIGTMSTNAVVRAILGLFTPAVVIVGFSEKDPWKYTFDFYDWHIPYLFASPIAQLACTTLIFAMMTRRMENPIEAPMRKALAYLFAFVVGLLIAGGVVHWAKLGLRDNAIRAATAFAAVYFFVGAFAAYMMTPSSTALQSWLWGLKGESRGPGGWLLGKRSPTLLAVIVLCAIGVLEFLLFVRLPLSRTATATPLDPTMTAVVATTTALMLAVVGVWMQTFAVSTTRLFAGIFVAVGMLGYTVATHVAGLRYNLGFLLAMSPSAHFAYWNGDATIDLPEPGVYFGLGPHSVLPMWFVLGGMTVLGVVLTLLYLYGKRCIIENKLRAMEVDPASAP